MEREALHGDKNDGLFLKSILSEYTNILYNFIRRFGFGDEETEDILQDIFIKIWKHINNFDEEKASLKTWIFTITKHTIYDALRKKKKTKILVSLDDENSSNEAQGIEDISADIIKLLEQSQSKEKILTAIDLLNEDEKTILLLHVEESMTFDELATIFDSPLNTVKSKYRRSLVKLKKHLEAMHQNKN